MKKYISSFLIALVAVAGVIASFQPAYAQGGTLEYGDTVSGELEVSMPDLWTFEGSTDDSIVISMDSDEFDTLITLKDADGVEIGSDDDSGEEFNALLEITLPTSGTFTIEAYTAFPSTVGAYSLHLELDDGSKPDDKDSDDEEQTVILEVEDELALGEINNHSFEGEAGDIIIIEAASDDFDTVLALLNSDGELLTRDDDGGSYLNSLIVVELALDDEYTIEISDYFDGEEGAYSLRVLSGAHEIELNETIEASFENQTIIYVVEGEKDTELTVELSSDDFDTVVEVRSSNGESLIEDDDSGGDLNSLASVVLTEDGTYFIVVKAFTEPAEGDFVLTVTAMPYDEESASGDSGRDNTSDAVDAGVISYGDTVEGTASGTIVTYTFEANADDEITITLSSTDFDAFLVLRNTDGNVVAENDDSDSSLDSLIEITLSDGGTYTIEVGSFDGQPTGDYTLSLSNE